jgi:phosphoglycerate dehydrogenase-like enzyme
MSFKIFVDLGLSPELLAMLQAETQGHQLLFPQKPLSSVLGDAVPDPQFATADIAFGQPDIPSITNADHLKWIHVSSSGITRYDNPKFRALMAERKIAVTNSASVYEEACAVHALSFMLAQARHLPVALKSRAANGSAEWLALRGLSMTLRGQKVLILGYGAIGKRLVELLRPFEMNIMAYRRKARGDEGIPIITPEQLERALAVTDHVINILPDNAGSRHFFDTARFAAVKPGAIFYNIGRGTTVDQIALLAVLRSGHLHAAWLDVTEPEPLPENHPLLAQPNCFITPHLAGGHVDETRTLVRHFLRNFERFTHGQSLLDQVM